ncbi:MAG: hypothetical protein EXR79_07915 [Myxococcales bacterium]|nr:hypothetical protein [Myxococcales bacterium]
MPDGTYVIVAALYEKADAAQPVWQELIKQLQVSGGFFTLDLGATAAIPDALLLSGQPLWLGVQVGGDAELPRVPVRAVARAWFAHAAAVADTAKLAEFAKTAEVAKTADAAKVADLAKLATVAALAESAKAADFAKNAEVAKNADTATLAIEAQVAKKLECTGCVVPAQLAPATTALFLSAKGGKVDGTVDITGATSVGSLAAAGFVRIGKLEADCGPAVDGTLRWTGKHLQVCDGKDWRQLDNATTPHIYGVNPSVATTAGGQTLLLSGTNFADGMTVVIGGVKATTVKVLSSTQAQVVVPAQTSAGAKDVEVISLDGAQSILVSAVAVELDGLAMWFDASRKDSWPGSGTQWLDVSGNAANAQFVNGLAHGTLGGIPTMVFDGTGAGAQFANAKLNTQKFTGVYWLYSQVPTSDNNTGGLYVNRDAVTANAGDLVWFGKWQADTWFFRVNNGGCCVDHPASGGSSWSGPVPAGQWKMVHFGYDVGVPNGWRWGVNGAPVGVGTLGSHPNSQSSTVSTIGWGHEGSGSYWKGGIAAARFYTRLLTDVEVLAEFARTKGQYGL